MKRFGLTFVLSSLLLVQSTTLFADEHGASEGARKFSEKSAVTAFDPEEGFKLSDSAIQSLGVRFKKLEGKGPWSVPSKSLVQIKHSSGVYRRYQGWIGFILVEAKNRKGEVITVQSEDLQPGDEVAVEGASFLRMTEADLNADTIDSCVN